MGRFTITSKAREDLKDIGRYTKRIWGRAKRIEYLDLLRSRMRDLAQGKLSGRVCYDISGFPWSSHVGRHVIFYRPASSQDGIEVLRVLHDAMDFPKHFEKN